MKKVLFGFLLVLLSANCLAASVPTVNHQDLIQEISKNKGKVVLVNFWAVWCGPCRVEIPELMKIRDKFSEEELAMYSISVDYDPAMLGSFLSKNPVNYSVYYATQDVSIVFGVKALPKLMIYNTKGEMIVHHEGLVGYDTLVSEIQKAMGK